MDIGRTTATSGPVIVRGDLPPQDLATRVVFPTRTAWGAIWAGLFATLGVEVVSTALMIGVFAGIASPRAAGPPGSAFDAGIAAWFFVQTIAAFYVGGRVTGTLSQPNVKGWLDGHALAVWGLSTTVILWVLVDAAGAAFNATLSLFRIGFGMISSGAASIGPPGGGPASNFGSLPVTAGPTADAIATWIPIYLFIVFGASYVLTKFGVRQAAESAAADGDYVGP